MSEPKWTPGPWKAFESSERCPLPAGVPVEIGTEKDGGARTGTICEMVGQGCDGKYSSEITRANACLIAAAPELYEALEEIHISGLSVHVKAAAALRKARGETT